MTREYDALRAGALSGAAAGLLLGREIVCLDETDSTNTEVGRRAAAGAPEGLAVLAHRQTGGRGRRGRSFQSPAGQGLYLSVLLRPPFSPARAVGLTPRIAVAVCDGIEAACGLRPGIKWPNDLILNGKKLCGILTEMEVDAVTGALRWVVAGMGTNVSQQPEDLTPEVRPIAISLAMAGCSVSREELALCQLRALDRMYRDVLVGRDGPYLEQYRRDCLTTGKPVRLLRGGGCEEAFALDIDDEFALTVRHPDGRTEAVAAGEVSVRGLLDYI